MPKTGNRPWNKGLTKETDDRLVKQSIEISKGLKKAYASGKMIPWNIGASSTEESKIKVKKTMKAKVANGELTSLWEKGHAPWNKGLTKETDSRLAGKTVPLEIREKIAKTLMGHDVSKETKKKQSNARLGVKPWNDGQTADTNPKVKEMCKKSHETKVKNNSYSTGAKKTGKILAERYRKGELKNWCDGLTKETDERLKKLGEKCSKTAKRQFASGERINSYKASNYKGGYREDLGHYVRSSWEADVARYLKMMNVNYKYEPKTFTLILKNGVETSYRPDFYLPEYDLYVEVKGYIRRKYKGYENKDEKVETFKLSYPDKKILFLDKQKYYKIFSERIFILNFNEFLKRYFKDEYKSLTTGE